jgi:hypothetical protein
MTVEWKLIEMPLPRLQMMGQSLDPFLYEIHWDARVQRRDVERAAGFDNRVLLKPRVGDYLLQLNGLLRPLIQRRWAAMVAQLNRLEDSQLEAFLFGADRVQTARIRAGLWEIQGSRCFYCDARLGDPAGIRWTVTGRRNERTGRGPRARLPRGHELRPPAVTGRGSSIWSTKPASTIAWCSSWSASAGACSYSSSVR